MHCFLNILLHAIFTYMYRIAGLRMWNSILKQSRACPPPTHGLWLLMWAAHSEFEGSCSGLTNLAESSKIKCEVCLFDVLVACIRGVLHSCRPIRVTSKAILSSVLKRSLLTFRSVFVTLPTVGPVFDGATWWKYKI